MTPIPFSELDFVDLWDLTDFVCAKTNSLGSDFVSKTLVSFLEEVYEPLDVFSDPRSYAGSLNGIL